MGEVCDHAVPNKIFKIWSPQLQCEYLCDALTALWPLSVVCDADPPVVLAPRHQVVQSAHAVLSAMVCPDQTSCLARRSSVALVAVDGKATLGSNVPPTLPLDRPLVSRGGISEGSLEDSDKLLQFFDKKDACPLVSGLNVIPCAQEAEPFEVCEGSLVDADEGKRLNRPARSVTFAQCSYIRREEN